MRRQPARLRQIALRMIFASTASMAAACTPGLQAPNDLGLISFLGLPGTAAASHTVGGSTLGLSSSLVLSLNAANDLTVQGDGNFAFPAGLAAGASYQVTVKTQPSSPVEYCVVSNGSGTVGGAVNNIEVACFQLPDTGQGTCYGSGGGIQTCGMFPTGQDGDHPGTPASIQNIASGSGTVRETASVLLWQQCAMGSVWSGSNCLGAPSTTSWSAAASYCADLTLAGQTWRLPSIRELLLWPDYGLNAPAADTSFFSATPGSVGSRFWSSTVNALNTARAWTVDASRGNTEDHPMGSGAYVRCVSGPRMPGNQFVARDSGVVYDQSTNLSWTKCSVINFGPPGVADATTTCVGTPINDNWDSAVDACDSLSFAGRTDWRLPSVRELATLVEYTSTITPLINTTFFPNTGATNYWTSTTDDQADSNAWHADFSTFVINSSTKGGNFRARCVATGP